MIQIENIVDDPNDPVAGRRRRAEKRGRYHSIPGLTAIPEYPVLLCENDIPRDEVAAGDLARGRGCSKFS